uniref:Dynamin_N domain-containing protein n=1 Tax=Strongyloides papillosus TaxID=174720 RepID=A0A0N5B6L9_STREA
MCGGGKRKESAASKRGNKSSSKKRVPTSVALPKPKKSSIKQEVVNLNINPLVIGALKSIPIFYQKCVYPMEKLYPINSVTQTLPWTDTEIIGKPTIIVVGASRTGKTSLINFFLDSDYKCANSTGPTNTITVIQFGSDNAEVAGKNACKESNFQFKQLNTFAEDMSDKVSVVNSTSNFLRYFNLIDTPGYKSTEIIKNVYMEYDKIYGYLFERVEGIIVTFDHERMNESMKDLVKLLSKHLHKTIFVLNKSEEITRTDELIKTRENILWFLSSETKNEKPHLLFGSYKKTPIKINPISELILKDMNEINEKIKATYIENTLTRLQCIENHCKMVYSYASFFSHLTTVIKTNYFVDKCTNTHQIESAVKRAFRIMPKNEIIKKVIPDYDTLLNEKFKLIDKVFKPAHEDELKELQEFIEVHFVNIFNAGKEERDRLAKTSDFTLNTRKIEEEKKVVVEKKKPIEEKKPKTNAGSKMMKRENEQIKKLEEEKKALEMEKKKREEEIRIKNELEAKEREEAKLKAKLEEEIKLKLELEMQKKLEVEKAKKAEEEKEAANQEKIKKLEEEKRLLELKKQQDDAAKASPKNQPIIVVVNEKNDKNSISQRSTRSNRSASLKSRKSDKGFNITLI